MSTSSVFLPTPTHWISGAGTLPHFSEHLENVRRHHSELEHQLQKQATDNPAAASQTILLNNLRWIHLHHFYYQILLLRAVWSALSMILSSVCM